MKFSTGVSGIVEDTITMSCTDLPQTFSDTQLENVNGCLPIACLITAEGNDIRFAFNTDPTQGIDGSGAVGHPLYARQSILLTNPQNVQSLRFINHTNAQDAILQASMFYEIGG